MKQRISLKKIKYQYHKKWKYVLTMLPILSVFTLFKIYPNIAVFPLSLYDWSPISEEKIYVGFKNFTLLFDIQGSEMIPKLVNTAMYVGFLLLIQTTIALLLTLSLRKNTIFNTIFRTYFFIPLMLSSTMISMTWNYMLDPNLGIFNLILGKLGVDGYPGTNLLGKNTVAILIIVIVHIWANIGYPIMMLLAGLSGVSEDLREAAKLDGANSSQVFWNVEFPIILPTLLRMALTTITTGAMAVDYLYMIGGNSSTNFDTWSSWIYRGTMGMGNYGLVSAGGVVLALILGTVVIVQYTTMSMIEKKLYE